MGAGSQEAQHSKPERLSTDRSDLRGHESVQAPGSQVPQGSHWSSAGTAPVRLPGQQIRWWCCHACPASLSAAPRDPQHICQGVVRGFLFSVQHNHPTEAVWQTDPHGRREVSVRVDSELPPGQAPVRIGKHTSEISLNSWAPQGCVLSPLLFSLFTNDSVSSEPSVVMIKFSDDTILEGLIQNYDESAYRGEVDRLAGWCSENDLELNVSKTKEMVFDFRKKKTPLVPLTIAGKVVEEVKTFKFLGTTISSDLKCDENISSAIKKAHQRLFFLRQLKKFSHSFHPDSVLPRCDWEHPDIFHHCLVQQRVSKGQRPTREDSPNSL